MIWTCRTGSFLAKIPADVPWTFQTLNKDGMVLNSSQTWHQLRPGEIRNDCGGCHAHSQKPTLFENTAAARADYKVFDLTEKASLITTKARDQSKQKWDAAGESGLRYSPGVQTVEYFRDIKPIFKRSCVACHTRDNDDPAGKLVLDDDTIVKATNPAGLGFDLSLPASYARLAADAKGEWGHKPLHRHGWTDLAASRYVRQMQSRRSLLIWKIFGRRLDGWDNDDFPYEKEPGDSNSLHHHGQPVEDTPQNRERSHVGYTGSIMPPPKAVKEGKVQPLSDEDRFTLVRWVDLGCPIDLTHDPDHPDAPPRGWALDDQRPTLTLTSPLPGPNAKFDRILLGMHDYGSGLDLESLKVTADFALNGAVGENLAHKFQSRSDGVWEWKLDEPVSDLEQGVLTISVRDRQGNTTRLDRSFRVSP